MKLGRRAFALGAATLVSGASGGARADTGPTFGLVLHRPTPTEEAHGFTHDLARSLALAQAIYRPLGFDLALTDAAPLDARFRRIESVTTRDALAPLVRAQRINVFLVDALRDADAKDVWRLGVTWDSRSAPVRRYIILTRGARDSSLAHELGHFFGIPEHSSTKNNLMSYDREDELVFLDDAQKARIKAGAARLFASRAQADVAAVP